MTRTFTAAVIALLTMGTPAWSQMYCQRPDVPSCARSLFARSQSIEFDECRQRLIRFQNEVREYNECQRQDREQLIQELDDAIRRFNDCARDRFC